MLGPSDYDQVQSRAYLHEANVGRLLTEALTADIQAILADQAGSVSAHSAVGRQHKMFATSIR